jgi:hypothetical protein
MSIDLGEAIQYMQSNNDSGFSLRILAPSTLSSTTNNLFAGIGCMVSVTLNIGRLISLLGDSWGARTTAATALLGLITAIARAIIAPINDGGLIDVVSASGFGGESRSTSS